MADIKNFYNGNGVFNDNSHSLITISPEGTKVMQVQQPQAQAEESHSEDKKVKGFTINQHLLLFSSLLDVGFAPSYNNQSQLADLIARVSGFDSESIRQSIVKLNNMSKYPKQLKRDAAMVADLLEAYNPKIAKDLRDTFIDEG